MTLHRLRMDLHISKYILFSLTKPVKVTWVEMSGLYDPVGL